ncbi:MAG: hypothetical protein IMZ71_02765 [Chloroflexi bacterium]|nr:hypothetical protein [Chloroflexota bacterium]
MSTTTFAQLISDAKSKKNFLVEIDPSEHVVGWTLHSGSIYKSEIGYFDVLSVTQDGTALTEAATLAAMGAGKWFWIAGWLYVQTTTGSIYSKVIVANYRMYYAKHAATFNDHYYEPFVLSVPAINQRKDDFFWGVSIIADGQVSLQNVDGYFDELYERLAWNAKACRILAGGEDLPYTEYAQMFQGTITDKNLGEELFDLILQDSKSVWEDSLVKTTFEKSAYANLHDEDVGKIVPLVFGTVFAMPVICTTRAKGTATSIHSFKAADVSVLGIKEITAVYVNNIAVGYHAGSIGSGTFKLSGSIYTPGDEVTADLKGFQSGTVLIENPIDVLKKIADIRGITTAEWDTDSLTAAKAEAVYTPIGLAVTEFTPTLDWASQIMRSCMGSFYIGNDGLYAVNTWDTDIPDDLDDISDVDIDIGSLQVVAKTEDIRKVVRAGWRKKWATGEFSYKQVTSLTTESVYGVTKAMTVETLLSSEAGATYLLDKLLLIYESTTLLITFTSKLQLASHNVGDRFTLTYRRLREDPDWAWLAGRVVEINSVSKDFDAAAITVTADDLKGIGGSIGHWTSDTPTFPDTIGGGSATPWDKTWTPERKAYAKAHFGYWTDDDGYADSTDADSFLISRWW